MKKSLIVLLLAAASVAAQAQDAPAGQQQPAPGAAAAGQQQKKVIQDPNEYNAYVAAVNATDPAQKAQLMESYLQTYPNSVMKEDGLELLLKTYQQLNNTAQIKTTAQRLLQVNPNNLTALALLSYLDRAQAQAGGTDAATSLQEAGQLGARGLQLLQTASKPEGYTDDQWNTHEDLVPRDLSGLGGPRRSAGQGLRHRAAEPEGSCGPQPTDVNSIYLLALAYLSPKPLVVDGLFWIAKAAAVRSAAAAYAKNQYARYHGSEPMASMRCWPRPRPRRRFLPDSRLRPRPRLPIRPPTC